jgi:hypothetical protein
MHEIQPRFGLRTATAMALASLFGASARAEPASIPPISASWHVGAPVGDYATMPRHYAYGPVAPDGMAGVVTYSQFSSNVLIAITTPVMADDGAMLAAAGSQFFQQAQTQVPTFCAVRNTPKRGHVCLVDQDNDGAFDSRLWSKPLLPMPILLVMETAPPTKLASPVAFQSLDRDTCECAGVISIGYIGRRQMVSKRDATFSITIGGKGVASSGQETQFDMDNLPSSQSILGAQFSNIRREDKILHFDLTSPITPGPFEPKYGGARGIEWGF